MTVTYYLIPVAFLQTTGGMFNVLLAVDEGDTQLFDGEPALIVSHRPFAAWSELRVEGAEHVRPEALDAVLHMSEQLATAIDAAHDRDGSFDGERLLGARIAITAPPATFILSEQG